MVAHDTLTVLKANPPEGGNMLPGIISPLPRARKLYASSLHCWPLANPASISYNAIDTSVSRGCVDHTAHCKKAGSFPADTSTDSKYDPRRDSGGLEPQNCRARSGGNVEYKMPIKENSIAMSLRAGGALSVVARVADERNVRDRSDRTLARMKSS